MSGYQKIGTSTHVGECKRLDYLPVPSKRTAAQDSSRICDCLGKCVFSSSSLRTCSRRWSSPLEAGFRRARALGALSLPPSLPSSIPPSKSSSQEQRQLVLPSLALRPRRPPWLVHSDMSCWHHCQNYSRAFKGPLEMKDMLVNCEAPHSGQDRHDSQGDLQRAPATGSWWQPPAVSPESSGCANTRAGGAGASDSLAFPT